MNASLRTDLSHVLAAAQEGIRSYRSKAIRAARGTSPFPSMAAAGLDATVKRIEEAVANVQPLVHESEPDLPTSILRPSEHYLTSSDRLLTQMQEQGEAWFTSGASAYVTLADLLVFVAILGIDPNEVIVTGTEMHNTLGLRVVS